MSKELIVSVNGREKKIAIIENGNVTEFYIERGEGNQGIVGNIYKGRVMRVLPGMQSAFVDIGLERDAFLYVSDFFDEEEEFERIVVDNKAKGGGGAAISEAARLAAAEKLERARLERERQMETAQERAEPLSAEGGVAAEIEDDEDEEVAGFEPAAAEDAAEFAPRPATPAIDNREAAGGRSGRRDRGRGRGRDQRELRPEETHAPVSPQRQREQPRSSSAAASTAESAGSFAEEVQARLAAREEIETPFAAVGSSFNRIVDEDEAAAGDGEMFKDARLQERILDQIHAVEFDLETPAEAEVGSLFAGVRTTGESSFQRIDDSDETGDAVAPRRLETMQPAVAAAVASFTDDALAESPVTMSAAPQAFERVSDDEKAVEALPLPAADETPDSAKRGSRNRRAGGARARKGTAGDQSPADETTTPVATMEAATTEPAEDAATKKRKSGRASESATKSRSKKATGTAAALPEEGTSAPATKGRGKRNRTEAITTPTSEDGGVESGGGARPDADASLKATPARGEFARRGGRRRSRRGGSGKPGAEGVAAGVGEEERTNGHAEEVSDGIEAEPVAAIHVAAPAMPAATVADDYSPNEPAPSVGSDGGGGRNRERGTPRGGDGDGGSSSGGNRGRGRERDRDRDRRSSPTITDLLREGQEILVQIAKEPIAQKGARITSHIALPGRFLVYMPTIEHVGVSRKIESDGERQRLRKLIQIIRQTEDVPSGGFIVRTAGTGISEQDLRDDARYLVRTWRDIRKNAEKQKAPALAHKDLDLVQRILRDQLSDDFTAIRVDSEEEYQEIVEFINRIQPRLVNRVKLYTRAEPILDAFGVQVELDKAIKPRVWLRSGGYLVINQTEALVAIDVNTGKFVGRGGSRLEDTITRTNLEAVDEIARQIRLRDLGGIIVLDLIDMEERRNRQRVMTALQDALRDDKSPTKVLSFNDFGLVIMTRKRVKQSLERTLCSPCGYCQGSGLVKSAQTLCYEILDEARRLARGLNGDMIKQTTLRLNPEVARALRSTERDVLTEIEDYLGAVDITSDEAVHQEQFDFAFV